MTQQSAQLRIGIVMAGGSGERFWPVSRRAKPKQLLALTRPDKSMLAEAVDRMTPAVGADKVYVVTGKHLVDALRHAMPGMPAEQILAEPSKRNTAGALAYTAAWLMARYNGYSPDAITMAVTTADHRIGDDLRFSQTVLTAMDAAEQQNALVVCGVAPTRPETGYGYIEVDAATAVMAGNNQGPHVYRACAFHEKPDVDRASQFLASGRHFWNSGMFFWKVSAFLDELKAAQPDMEKAVWLMAEALKGGDDEALVRHFETIESASIDFALMEKARNVLAVKADFPWADVGAWNSLAEPDTLNSENNFCLGEPIVIDCANTIVYNEQGADKMAVGVVGMQDVIVVATADAVLVLPRDRAQDVRAVVEELKRRNGPQL